MYTIYKIIIVKPITIGGQARGQIKWLWRDKRESKLTWTLGLERPKRSEFEKPSLVASRRLEASIIQPIELLENDQAIRC